MYKAVIVLSLLAAARSQAAGGDLEDLIAQVFNTPTTKPTPVAKPSTLVPPVTTADPDVEEPCKTEDGQPGVCVKYYLCDASNNTIINDGVNPRNATRQEDLRVQDGSCASYMDTCCLTEGKLVDPITPPPPVVKQEGCGWRNPDGVGFRITGDKDGESKFGEFPWMVAVLQIEPVNEAEPNGQKLNVYVGGGSLINPSVVLTTAHYVAKAKQLRVRAGEWDTQTTKEIYPYQDRDVASVEIHKDFNKGNLFYDVALLFLASPMELAQHIGLACLPPASLVPPGGTRCFATGWGKDKFGKDGRYQVILKKIELPVVEPNPCKNALRKTRLGRFFELHHTFMCAGGEAGKDVCKGDGGSPLVCPIEYEKNRFMQSGMVAWGIGCGEDGTPGVYVNIAKVRSWIDDKVIGHGLTITYDF